MTVTMPSEDMYRSHVISWNLTQKCNLRCEHCYISAGRITRADAQGELTTEEALAVVDQLCEVNPEALLILTGGEPLKINIELTEKMATLKEKVWARKRLLPGEAPRSPATRAEWREYDTMRLLVEQPPPNTPPPAWSAAATPPRMHGQPRSPPSPPRS